MSSSPNTVVILGASFVGIRAAHHLLKKLPAEYKVVLVNPSTHLFWNFAAPRAVAKADQFGKDNANVFYPIEEGFKNQPATRFEFVVGKATALDPSSSSVTVVELDADGKERNTRTVTYSQLLIATGSRAHNSFPFKTSSSRSQTIKALKDVNVKIEAAKTIVFSGAGATGVETVGEVATLWKNSGKKIYLINNADRVLPTTREDVSAAADKMVRSLGVIIKNNVSVESESSKDGALELKLTNGETIVADIHIPTFGLFPNSEWIPAELLDEKKSVKITSAFQSTSHANIWAAGDVAAVSYKQAVNIPKWVLVVVDNIVAAVQGKDDFREFDDSIPPLVVPIGGGFAMGTGLLGSWKMWGFLVWLLKGRDYFVGKAKAMVIGKF